MSRPSTARPSTGEYHEVFDVLFDDKGKRIENVVFAPQSIAGAGQPVDGPGRF